jgi:hypothetical protein
MELDMKASSEVCKARCAEYRQVSKKEKGRILDEIVSVSKGNRDYWATKLRNYNRSVYAEVEGKPVRYVARDQKKKEKHPGGRPGIYKGDFVKLLTSLWSDFGCRSAKRFMPDVRGMIEFLCSDKQYKITKKLRRQLLAISPAQADRLLAPAKKKLDPFGVCTTRPGKLNLRSQVPVCTWQDRAKAKPGEFCTDTCAYMRRPLRGERLGAIKK